MIVDPLSINEDNIDSILDESVKLGFLDYHGKLYECRYYEHRDTARKICEDNHWDKDPDYDYDPEGVLNNHGFIEIFKMPDRRTIDIYPVLYFHFSTAQLDYIRNNLIGIVKMNPVTESYLKEEVLDK